MNKKGASVIVFIFEVLIVVGVIAASIGAANKMSTSDSVKQEILTKSITMMIETLIASPGDAVVQIPTNMTGYEVIIREYSDTQSEVVVTKEKDSITQKFSRPFALGTAGKESSQEHMCLTKKKKHISIEGCNE